MADLVDLEYRLSKEIVPNRALDEKLTILGYKEKTPIDEYPHLVAWKTGDKVWSTEAPHMTSSLDAAVALVDRLLPGVYWSLATPTMYNSFRTRVRVYQAVVGTHGKIARDAVAYNPALALCLALVRSLLEEQPK
jgi:hypothetical protein